MRVKNLRTQSETFARYCASTTAAAAAAHDDDVCVHVCAVCINLSTFSPCRE